MIIDARETTVEKIVEYVRGMVANVDGFTDEMVEECLANTAEEAGYIWDTLIEHGIPFEIVEKEGWGKVFKFRYGERLVFTKTYFKLSDKLELYYWHGEYSCERCPAVMSRVNRAKVKSAIEARGIPEGGILDIVDIRDLAPKFSCYYDGMCFIAQELGYELSPVCDLGCNKYL